MMTKTPAHSKNSLPRQGERGFTLIEVVIALTVFSIGLLAASLMQSAAIKGNKSSSAISQSSNWVAGKMEEVLTVPYDNIVDGTVSSPDGLYTLSWQVTNDTPITSTKTVVITSTWNLRGRAISSQFTEIISQAD